METTGTVTEPQGFKAGVAAAAIKTPGRPDVALVVSERDCAATAVFTQNQVVAAPVIVSRETLQHKRTGIRAVVANAGNANACTGTRGLAAARQMQTATAESLEIAPDQVLVLSTGIIGVQLPMDKIEQGIHAAAQNLSPDHGADAARAIMTTDTRPKQVAATVELPGGVVTIAGMAKGSGMIHPNMATMLALITTDAGVEAGLLDGMLQTAVNASFNRISVDGDTSTNDTVLLLANGASGVTVESEEAIARFGARLNHVCLELAQMIVRDGEGASKFVEIQVAGAPDDAAAHRVAETIATSPLVKTAFAGSDANWGRILAAAGRAGVAFDQHKTSLWVGNERADALQLVANGTPTDYEEADAAAVFAQTDILVRLDLGAGEGIATMWTTDLTHKYVTINADYRT